MLLGDIARQRISLDIPSTSKVGLALSWRPDDHEIKTAPCTEEEEAWLDWISPIEKTYTGLGPASHTNPYEQLDEFCCITRVVLEHGNIFAADFPRNIDCEDFYALWRFVDDDGAPPEPFTQALDGRLVLQIKVEDSGTQLDNIRIQSSAGWTLAIKPVSRRRTLVQASITNLPHISIPGQDHKRLKHLELLKRIAVWKAEHGEPLLPELMDPGVTSGDTFCPPLFYK